MVITHASSSQSILPLQMHNISVTKRGKTILQDLSCTLQDHQFTIVMGPNGAGKTTFLRLMHGLERPKQGTLNWATSALDARTKQAFVFQTPILMRRSVLENTLYPLTLRGIAKKQAEKQANAILNNVGLSHCSALSAHNLSGGERQKLALARALIIKPQVLFLDEPTSNLDGRSTKEIEAILQSCFENKTRIVMTTHDIGQAKRLASDVMFLHKGSLCEHTKASVFFKTPQSKPAKIYLQGDIVE